MDATRIIATLAIALTLIACGGGGSEEVAAEQTAEDARGHFINDASGDKAPLTFTLPNAAAVTATVRFTFKLQAAPNGARSADGTVAVIVDGVAMNQSPVLIETVNTDSDTTLVRSIAVTATLPAGMHTIAARFTLNSAAGILNEDAIAVVHTVVSI